MTPEPVSKPQGRDDVVVDAPSEILWDLISDSRLLARWGPPVTGVEVFVDEGKHERIGSLRKVYARFGRRSGWFLERRVEHVEGRAIAMGEVEGPSAALAALDAIASDVDGYHLLHAARGTMLRQLGRADAARAAFERAADLAPTDADRRFLAQQMEELADGGAQT